MARVATRSNLSSKVSSVEELEKRFHFIDDDILRKNIALAFQYTIFLIAVLDQEGAEDTSISSSMHKDMIVQTACAVEACLHYCLRKSIDMGKLESGTIMPIEEKDEEVKELYKISENEHIFSVRRIKRPERLTRQTQFIVLNRAALHGGIFNKEAFDKAEELRTMRNKIHLAGLQSTEGSYKRVDSEKAFQLANYVVKKIEEWLTVT